jgi:hypothetical protein
MKVLVLYRPNSEFARRVEEFVHNLKTRNDLDDRHLEVMDIDSREGAATASLYDVMTHPSVVVVGDDGSYVKSWEGGDLPLLDEVAGYTFSFQ